MKRIIFLPAAVLILVSGMEASGFLDRWSFTLSPAGMLPWRGQYTDTLKLHQVVNPGLGLNAGLRYRVNDYVFLEAEYAFSWMGVRYDYRPFDYKEFKPGFDLQAFSLNGLVFLSTDFVIKPYVIFGAGVYPWEFSQRFLWTDPWPAPSNSSKTFSKTSLGVSGGFGIETQLSRRLSIFAQAKYHYIYSRDPDKFGTDDFTEQDFLGLSIGLVWGFGKR